MNTTQSTRRGDWLQTYTGKKFYPFDPKAEDICIEDIAHSLSLQCRFAGHCREFYSVAQHCIIGAINLLEKDAKELAKLFLLHDSTEAYLCDLPRPVKTDEEFGSVYRALENELYRAIEEAFCLPLNFATFSVIKEYDNRMLLTEKRDLLDHQHGWKEKESVYPPFEDRIDPLTSMEAEKMFLEMYHSLV